MFAFITLMALAILKKYIDTVFKKSITKIIEDKLLVNRGTYNRPA